MSRVSVRGFSRLIRYAAGASLALLIVLALAGCGRSSQKEKAPKATTTAQGSATQQAQQPAQAANQITGTVEYAEGEVTLNGLPVQIGAAVNNGDTIKTGSNGVCNITFLQRNIVQIQADSLAVVNFGDIGRGIQLQSGSLAAVLKNLTSTATGMRFQVDTPTTTAGVRGTAFFIKVIDPNTTYFCLCNGEIHLQDNTGGNQETLEAAHHSAVEYIRKDGKISVEKQPMLYHHDSEMEQLAKKIGYTIDWSKPDLVN